MGKKGKKIMSYVGYGIGAILLYLAGLSIASRFISNHGLIDGRLQACSDKPNCVCSEDYPNRNYQPIEIGGRDAIATWEMLKNIIINTGGDIGQEEAGYLWATYTTPLMRFIDDVELRLDEQHKVIHIRSASRVGSSDLGANKQRVDNIVNKLKASAD